MKNDLQIIILDYGSQYTQLLARRVRELGIYNEVWPHTIDANTLKQLKNLKGIILSGGPSSVYDEDAYTIDEEIFNLNIPILGVCYGMQLISQYFGGTVELAETKEFGKTNIIIDHQKSKLFENVEKNSIVWMSHSDFVAKLPQNFIQTAHSLHSIAAIEWSEKNIYGIQFHCEVTHSQYGTTIIKNFIFEICNAKQDWSTEIFLEEQLKSIKTIVQDNQVILGLSGGVDSSVAAALISKAVGQQLTCIFVDTGLLRKNEAQNVMESYQTKFDLKIKLIDASQEFFTVLKGIKDPEEKRKIIGKTFVDIFNREALKLKQAKFLAQGTIYPDIIESSSNSKTSKVIKSHHNVGGLPEDLNFQLLEPLKTLFKDEVRKLGSYLGLPDSIINRHPFPGPGLGVRIIEEISEEKAKILQEVDDIFISNLIKANLYDKVSQAFATILPVKTVGVMGDNRTYEYVVALRSVNTIDFMTATASHLPWEFLDDVVNQIINNVSGVNRVVYDITSKPPGTIEWE